MKNFINISKHTLSFTLNGEGAGAYYLGPGDSAKLPEENKHVVALVGRGLLKETENKIKPKKEE